MVSDIPAGDGKMANLFLQCKFYSVQNEEENIPPMVTLIPLSNYTAQPWDLVATRYFYGYNTFVRWRTEITWANLCIVQLIPPPSLPPKSLTIASPPPPFLHPSSLPCTPAPLSFIPLRSLSLFFPFLPSPSLPFPPLLF